MKRVALANVLISEPELLILDEPTNHLDLEMTEWLEEHLNRSRMSLLMVTHDRYFLDQICTQIPWRSTSNSSTATAATSPTTWRSVRSAWQHSRAR